MIDMLVSRFLYILCWRNRVVIVLIILSASMGMLITLSYHSNKNQSHVAELLRIGRGHIPLEHHLNNQKKGIPVGMFTDKGHRLKEAVSPSLQQVRETSRQEDVVASKKTPNSLMMVGTPGPESGKEKVPLKIPEGQTIPVALQKMDNHKYIKDRVDLHKEMQQVLTGTGHGGMLAEKNGILVEIHGRSEKGVQKISSLDDRDNTVTTKKSHDVKPKDKVIFQQEGLPRKINAKNISMEKVDRKTTHMPHFGNENVQGQFFLREKDLLLKDKENTDSGKLQMRKNAVENFQYAPDKKLKYMDPLKIIHISNVKANINEGVMKRSTENVLQLRKFSDNVVRMKVASNDILNVQHGKKIYQQSNNIPYVEKNAKGSNAKHQKPIEVSKGPLQYTPNQNHNQDWWKDHNIHMSTKAHIPEGGVPLLKKERLEMHGQLKKQPESHAKIEFQQQADHKLNLQKQHRLENSLKQTQNNGMVAIMHKQTTNRPLFPVTRSNSLKEKQNILEFQTTKRRVKEETPNISSVMLALARQRKPVQVFSPYHSNTLYRAKGSWPEVFSLWLESEEQYCDRHFMVVNSEFARLKNVIIDRNFCHCRKGGEEIVEVINQPEEEEYYTYFPGFFQISCQVKPQYIFNNNNHLNQWLYSMNNLRKKHQYDELRQEFTIAIVRYEYANMYHTTTDFYNAFLLMELFNKTQTETNILLIDGHPQGGLDPVWSVLFNSSRRIHQQSMRTKYSQLVWGILGYNSPMMDHYSPNIPLVEEFRTFFLSSYRIKDNRKLDCDKINILFIWRRDYVAHPRNPSGSISRKIQNEQELVLSLRQNFPSFSVKGVQIDLFEMDQQLKFITETDVLIGMHGAGLTHAMFLPKHAGMIELLPTYWSAANEHFHAIARWRHLHYRQWMNDDPENEAPNYFTKIPPEVLNGMVSDMVKVVCGLATDPPDMFVER